MGSRRTISICGKVYPSIIAVTSELGVTYSKVRTRLSSPDFPDWVCDQVEKTSPVVSKQFENWIKKNNKWEKV